MIYTSRQFALRDRSTLPQMGALVALALLAAACDGLATTEPTVPETTTTTIAPATTTTIAPVTTTTSGVVAGVAILSDGVLLGWWSEGSWHGERDYRLLTAGEEYRVFGVHESETDTVAGPPQIFCDVVLDEGTGYSVELNPPAPGLGVSADSPASAGEADPIETGPAHLAVAHSLLDQRGIDHSEPTFAQLIRTDLDRDGSHRHRW